MDKVVKIVGTGVLVLAGVVILAVIMAFPTKWLWNYLMPVLFGLKYITVWQALAMDFLCGILFKSHGSTSSK